MRRRVGSILIAVSAAVALAGCAGGERARPVTVHVGSAGSSPAAVFYPEDVSRILVHLQPIPERSRLNDDLAWRRPAPVLASGDWPQAPRPQITRQRRIHIIDRADTFLFFLQEPKRRGPYVPPY